MQVGLVIACVLAGEPAAASAVEPPETTETAAESARADPEPARTFDAEAFVDTAYIVNSNLPQNHLYRGAFTTPRTGEFTLALALVQLRHRSTDDEPWRFQLALQAGAEADALYESEPVPGGDDGRLAGPEVFKHLGLANGGVRIRRTKTRIEGGIMASPLGIGGSWSKDNWNYSPSWAANAAPYFFAGGRIIQDIADGFGAHAWVVNGWQTIADVNAAPSYLAGLHYEGDEWTVYTQAYFGPDDVQLRPEYWRVHLDNWVIFNRDRIGAGAVLDGGREKVATATGDDVVYWLGAAAFFRARVWEHGATGLELSARPELFWDKDGRLFGVPQALAAATGTVGMDVFGHALVRVEYRYDHSTAFSGFFYRGAATADDDTGLANDQHTVFLSLVGHIEHAFALPRRNSKR
jgi:hypothetical protein